jgi:hypothetical protein
MGDRQYIRRRKFDPNQEQSSSDSSSESRQPRQRAASIWELLKGQRLVIQCKTGIIIEGEFLELDKGLLRLSDATVKGKNHIAHPQWLLLERVAVAHIHPVCEVEAIGLSLPQRP